VGALRHLRQYAPNLIQHVFKIVIQGLIPKPEQTKSLRLQPRSASCIVFSCRFIQLLRTIQLDNAILSEANKINYVLPNRRLSAKLLAQLAAAEEMPERLLGRSRFVAQLPGKFTLDSIAVYAACSTPSPQGGGSQRTIY